MILIGMYDSPFVRRVALTLQRYGIAHEHRNWSVGRQQAEIRAYNPVGRVPTLVLDDGEALIESAAILDWLEESAPDGRALMPRAGAPRRHAQRLMALAAGAADKAVLAIYERLFRPAEKVHEPWLQRLHGQCFDALAALDAACAARPGLPLVGDAISQADVTVTCVWTFVSEALQLPAERYPALAAFAARHEALPEFAALYVPFLAPGAPVANA